ncbi:adenylate/guanylate cyclase domain-containing protein [Leptospira ilyithenensis]|uniref:Adenylate/guanylate cyclase domain-containing protein n=1 Tax=Leptospira ilyithenensis TaxID=2484901 RepID=A0A4R9LVJ7_9LEPT|nr:adenylate/guanylate cyclase domain-containing protein [Leptospira ilyithenensis]TGN14718.1 adenylate/guanylate cyclase domain-containing protein [Leptospira ilyithenensis]
MKNQKFFLPFLLSVIVPVFVLLIFAFLGISEVWNRKISDSFFLLLPSHNSFSKDVVIVDIDEQSLAQYADNPDLGRWPWKRTVYPILFSYIQMGAPKLILVDILFTGSSEDDSSIAEANRSFSNISHAVNFRTDINTQLDEKKGKNKKFEIPLPGDSPFPTFNTVSFPNGEIGETTPLIHAVNIIPDNDGTLRRFAPFLKWEDSHYPTIAYQGFAGGEEIKTSLEKSSLILSKKNKTFSFPLGKSGLIRSYFYSEKQIREIPRYSAGGVLQSQTMIQTGKAESEADLIVPPSFFTDKIVLIGTSAAATHDDVVTPFGLFPGVIAQAVFASNMIENHVLYEIPEIWGGLFAVILLTIGTYVLFFATHHWLRIVFPIFATAVFLISFYVCYRFNTILPPSHFVTSFPVSYLLGYAYLTYIEGKDKRKYNNILRNLVDPSVVSHALEDLESLKKGGEWEITAFFSDVAGFSSISEELSPSELARLLNEYLSAMTEILKSNSGTLDKYIGDAIVGIFGAPLKNAHHPELACKASLTMIQKLAELKTSWTAKNDYTESARKMKIRIGLNCGPAKVGFMGTESLASYTMMGDTVNLASRLEAAAKDYGADILVSETIEAVCKEHFQFRFLDRIRVKGKDQPVKIYSLLSTKEKQSDNETTGEIAYRNAFDLYSKQKWKEAIQEFEKAEGFFGKKDVACQLLIKRCEVLFQEPPGENWDGVFSRTTK